MNQVSGVCKVHYALYYGIYFNIVDLCGILPYKRMYPYKFGIKINIDILTTQKDQ